MLKLVTGDYLVYIRGYAGLEVPTLKVESYLTSLSRSVRYEELRPVNQEIRSMPNSEPTPQKVLEMKKLYDETKSVKAVAKKFQCSVSTVRLALYEHGIGYRKGDFSLEEDKQIRCMAANGIRTREIAKSLNRQRKEVAQRILVLTKEDASWEACVLQLKIPKNRNYTPRSQSNKMLFLKLKKHFEENGFEEDSEVERLLMALWEWVTDTE